MNSGNRPARVVVGELLGPFGVRGWVKVRSYTDPPENILRYSPWFIGEDAAGTPLNVVAGRKHGHATVVACLEGLANRDAVMELKSRVVAVSRANFAPLPADQYYWADLIGLQVVNLAGVRLGVVAALRETGANDVMVVRGERERIIPFVKKSYVLDVNFDTGTIVVDWDADF